MPGSWDDAPDWLRPDDADNDQDGGGDARGAPRDDDGWIDDPEPSPAPRQSSRSARTAEPEDVAGGDDDSDEDLSLDPAAQQALKRRLNQQRANAGRVIAEERRALGAAGLQVVNGQVRIVDQDAFRNSDQFRAMQQAQQQAQQQAPPEPEPVSLLDPSDPAPDPITELDAYHQWFGRQMVRAAEMGRKQAVTELSQTLDRRLAPVREQQVQAAWQRVEGLVEGTALGDLILGNPDSQRIFERVLNESGGDPGAWTDRRFLHHAAGLVAGEIVNSDTEIAEAISPRRPNPPSRGGRTAAQVSRVAAEEWGRAGPTRSSAHRASPVNTATPAEREHARSLQMSVEEFRAWRDDPTGQAGLAYMERRNRRNANGARR